MRKTRELQSSIFDIFPNHALGQEYQAISRLLDQHPRFIHWVARDLGCQELQPTGRRGLSAETILRACIVMKLHGLAYEDLAIQISDSNTFRAFCRIGHREPSKSALQNGISRIRAETWQKINRGLLLSTEVQGIEKGRMVRIDSTPVESDIHKPMDSHLLWDGIRVMGRLLKRARKTFPSLAFCDRGRAAKKRLALLCYQSRKTDRKAMYRDLLRYATETVDYLEAALAAIPRLQPDWRKWRAQAQRIVGLTKQVIAQAQRRVFEGEHTPACDKVISLFEDHSDIIVKGRRDVVFGHKVNLTAGRSGMILDLVVEMGNPADSERATTMVQRQIDIYGRPPRQCAFDGAYASQANLREIKALGAKDVMFQKKRGLTIEAMTGSPWIYRKLQHFRAGIESVISCMKRAFGWKRCTWKGLDHFKAYVWSSAVAFNLATLGRKLVALQV